MTALGAAVEAPARDAAAAPGLRELLLIGLLAFVVTFEGFDVSVTTVVLPYVAKEFGAPPTTIGQAVSAIALGSILAALLVRQADRFGRRPMLILSAAGFALGSLATMLSSELWHYAACQFVTRMLAVTQIAMSYLILSESLPPAWRGRANGLLGASGSLGAALPFLMMETSLSSSFGWRGLFLIGGAPLLTLPLLLLFLRETPAFLAARVDAAPRLSWIAQLRLLTAPALRKRFVLMSACWTLLNFGAGATTVFFTTYVVQERGWQPADLTVLGPAILLGALSGNLISGFLLDRIGRRPTISLFLLAIGACAQMAYMTGDDWTIAAGWIGIQAGFGVWAALFTLNSELFPTELRGAANGLCNNLIGRWGMVAGPAAAGALSAELGTISLASFWLAFSVYAAIPLLWLLPETRGARLDAVRASEE